MLLLLGLIIWTLVPTDCSPYNTEHEDKECEKICIMMAQCIKQRPDIDGKSSCKETEFNEKCLPVCPTLYDLNRNLTKRDSLLSNNDFLDDDDDDAIAEDRSSMIESNYNHKIKLEALNRLKSCVRSKIDFPGILNDFSRNSKSFLNWGTTITKLEKKLNKNDGDIRYQGKKITELNKTLTELKNSLNLLESENKDFKDKLKAVELYSNDLDQDARKNTMVIHGIPFNEGENTTDLFLKISEATGVPFFSKDIDYAYRLEPHTEGSDVNDSLPIIVRLLRNSDYRKFMNHEKPCNVNTTADREWLKIKATCKLQIDESFTPYNDKLYDAALALKLDGKIKNAWMRDGKILIMKEDGSKPVEIKTSEDLDEFN